MSWAAGLSLACGLLIAIYVAAELLAQRPAREWLKRVRDREAGLRAMRGES